MVPLRVFILDDDRDSILYLSICLKGIEDVELVGTESNPAVAIPEIVSSDPDLLLLDIEMPGMSGFDVLSALKVRNCNPSVVLISSYLQYAIKGMRERVIDYLVKPVSFSELKFCIIKYQNRQTNIGKKKLSVLNETEQKIAEGLFLGQTSTQIGDRLCLSPNTVDKYRCQILKKTGMKSTLELISHYSLS